MLRCPKCKKQLIKKDHAFVCEEHHNYDIAKQGYVNLVLSGKKNSGDDAEMIKSRRTFLQAGYYEPLQKALIEAIKAEKCKVLIDAGCGEGYYTSACSEICDVYGFDLSKSAVKLASAFDKRSTYAIASIAKLPLEDECADAVLSVFAPCDETEFYRVLKPNGLFLKVEPATKHLYELKQVLYDDVYLNDEHAMEYEQFLFCLLYTSRCV